MSRIRDFAADRNHGYFHVMLQGKLIHRTVTLLLIAPTVHLLLMLVFRGLTGKHCSHRLSSGLSARPQHSWVPCGPWHFGISSSHLSPEEWPGSPASLAEGRWKAQASHALSVTAGFVCLHVCHPGDAVTHSPVTHRCVESWVGCVRR